MDIFILKNGDKLVPFTEPYVRGLLDSAIVSPTDLAWHERLSDWIPLGLIVSPETTSMVNTKSDRTPSKGAFRMLVTLTFGALIATIVAAVIQTPAQNTEEVEYQSVKWIFLMSVFVHFVSYVGLLLLKRWGRMLFTVSSIIIALLDFFQGTNVESAALDGFSTIFALLSGAIIALSYATPLFNVFGTKQPSAGKEPSLVPVQDKPLTDADFPDQQPPMFGFIPPAIGNVIGSIFVTLILAAGAANTYDHWINSPPANLVRNDRVPHLDGSVPPPPHSDAKSQPTPVPPQRSDAK